MIRFQNSNKKSSFQENRMENREDGIDNQNENNPVHLSDVIKKDVDRIDTLYSTPMTNGSNMSITFTKNSKKLITTPIAITNNESLKKGVVHTKATSVGKISTNPIKSSIKKNIIPSSNGAIQGILGIPGIVADGQGGILTIASLPEEEKAKITRLVDRLVSLGKENEETMATLHLERAKHLTDMENAWKQIELSKSEASRLSEENRDIKSSQETKEKLYLSYLQLYQNKIEELARAMNSAAKTSAQTISAATSDMVTKLVKQQKDISQLEALCQSQRATLETYELTRTRTQQSHEVALALVSTEREELRDEVNILRKELESSHKTIRSIQQSLETMTNNCNTTQSSLEAKDQFIHQLEDEVLELKEQLHRQEEIKESSVPKTIKLISTQMIHGSHDSSNNNNDNHHHHHGNVLGKSIDMSAISGSSSWILPPNPNSNPNPPTTTTTSNTTSHPVFPNMIPSNDNPTITLSKSSSSSKKKKRQIHRNSTSVSISSDFEGSSVTTKRGTATVTRTTQTPPRLNRIVQLSQSQNISSPHRKSSELTETVKTTKSSQPSITKTVNQHRTGIPSYSTNSVKYDPKYDSSLFRLLDDIEAKE